MGVLEGMPPLKQYKENPNKRGVTMKKRKRGGGGGLAG